MKQLLKVAMASSFVAFLPVANAQVAYTATEIGGSIWQYDYTLSNPLLDPASEFTIFFDLNKYSNLTVRASPGTWSSLVVQPDAGLPADGFFDTLSLNGGLLPGKSQSGFSVQTTYTGQGTPGSQLFNIVDSVTFAILDFGDTTPSNSSSGGGSSGGGGFVAPEIDPTSTVSALTLLFGGLAVMRGRRSPKQVP
jgi:hypothetical protein